MEWMVPGSNPAIAQLFFTALFSQNFSKYQLLEL
jgi:hypothetical protein